MGLTWVGVSSMMGAVNYVTTIVKMRAPGMTMMRLPLSIWGLMITSLLQLFALPVLTAASIMQLLDRVLNTGFFTPTNLLVNNLTPDSFAYGSEAAAAGGQPLLWQHLFWFYSHPAVYILVLPAMGFTSDILAVHARKPIFGYKPMVYSMAAIAGLGFIVWGHHMFTSGMNPALGMTFMVSTIMIALPQRHQGVQLARHAVGRPHPPAHADAVRLAFVSMFIIGGLSGIWMAATPVDIYIHDTYIVVAHFHYVVFAGSLFAIFAAIYHWFPKMFGRLMNETMGKIHFVGSFIFTNMTFFYMMHQLGVAGLMRRTADPYAYDVYAHLQPINEFITISAFCMFAWQIFFVAELLPLDVLGQARRPQPVEGQLARVGRAVAPGPRQLRPPARPSTAALTSSARPKSPKTTSRRRARSERPRAPAITRRSRDAKPSPLAAPARAGTWLAALPLVVFGGSVTTLRAGMAIDGWWVLDRGNGDHFLLAYPIEKWFANRARSASTAIASSARWSACCRSCSSSRRTVRRPERCACAGRGSGLLAVCLQGTLGGFRVLENSPNLAFLHGVVAQVVLAILAANVVLNDSAFAASRGREHSRAAGLARASRLAIAAVFAQIFLGAWLRHTGNDLALVAHIAFAAIAAGAVIVLARGLREVRDAELGRAGQAIVRADPRAGCARLARAGRDRARQRRLHGRGLDRRDDLGDGARAVRRVHAAGDGRCGDVDPSRRSCRRRRRCPRPAWR
jgi:hypothetical protein